jgi:chemotaxis protein CheX
MEHLEAEQIAEAVRTVWATTIGLEVELGEPSDATDCALTGSVGISGKWQGAITMRLPAGLARAAAAAMFMTEVDETSADEMQDALGELVNQVAGIVRPMVSDCCVLSLPTVATGDDARLRVHGASPLLEVPLACEGESILVTLLKKNES